MSSCRNSVCRNLPSVELLKFCPLEVTQFQFLKVCTPDVSHLHILEILSTGGCPLLCKGLSLKGYQESNDETDRGHPVPGVETPPAGGEPVKV